jgi:hypothetical protein
MESIKKENTIHFLCIKIYQSASLIILYASNNILSMFVEEYQKIYCKVCTFGKYREMIFKNIVKWMAKISSILLNKINRFCLKS